MKFSEWFDPNHPYHIEAVAHLNKTGSWPKCFIPQGMEMDAQWHYILLQKMAFCWLKYMATKQSVPLEDPNPQPTRMNRMSSSDYYN